MTTKRESKRILSVTVKRIQDSDADTSYLGEFSDTPEQYAIVHVGEHAGEFVDKLPCECGHVEAKHNEDMVKTVDVGCTVENCSCDYFDRVDVPRDRNYRYFNPVAENYSGSGPEDEIEKYCLQDYERMRTLGDFLWAYLGITAEAEVQLTGDLCQTITSGGLWGIESDSDRDHFRMVETEELDQLKAELHAIGFSKRAITAAFRNVEHKDV